MASSAHKNSVIYFYLLYVSFNFVGNKYTILEKMESIYTPKQKKIPIQQGVIINGCIAENYTCETFGLIITPRCDIGNGGKVATIHYLPIVPLKEWILVDCLQNCIKKLKKSLSKSLEGKGISSTILEHLIDIEDFKKIVAEIPNNQSLITKYNEFTEIINNKRYDCQDLQNLLKQECGELYDSKHNRCLLLKDWNNSDEYYVVLLRDVKRISFDLVSRFPNGFQNKNLDPDLYLSNDIYRSDYIYYFKTLALISSPYIEYIIQQFSYNFCRIGVDHPIDKEIIKTKYKLDMIMT